MKNITEFLINEAAKGVNQLEKNEYLYPGNLSDKKLQQLKNDLKNINCKHGDFNDKIEEVKQLLNKSTFADSKETWDMIDNLWDYVWQNTNIYPWVQPNYGGSGNSEEIFLMGGQPKKKSASLSSIWEGVDTLLEPKVSPLPMSKGYTSRIRLRLCAVMMCLYAANE